MKLSRTAKNMVTMIGLVALVFIVGGIIFHRSIHALYFAIGVILTSSLNVGKVYMLERTVSKTLDMEDPNSGKNYVKLQYLLRYAITGVVLLGVGLVTVYVDPPFVNIWGAVAGIFTLQISVIIVRHRGLDDETGEA
ncbi:MAG: hypothetical protein FWB97_05670 [Oscillospiraceae bacterium]|nr:hypothetical protein [Oscillospiraceae bacterium]